MGDEKIGSLSKGLQIIRQLVYEKERLGVRELARKLDLTKSTALRLLQLLCNEGVLALNEIDKKYEIGPDLWRLGVVLRGREDLYAIAMSTIRKYAAPINEEMSFFRYSQGGVVFEGVVESDHALRFGLKLGIPHEIQRASSGKIILAFLPFDERNKIFEKLKKNPSVDIEILKKQVEQTRIDGYASSKGERTVGVIGFSVPIIGPDDVLLGGVGLHLPEARYRFKDRKKYINTLKACAAEISSIVNPLRHAKSSSPLK
jgi:DNA-binding IclR family transcriptional regulator